MADLDTLDALVKDGASTFIPGQICLNPFCILSFGAQGTAAERGRAGCRPSAPELQAMCAKRAAGHMAGTAFPFCLGCRLYSQGTQRT